MFTVQRAVMLVGGALLMLGSIARAQGPFSSGTFESGRDQKWEVSLNGGSFFYAYEVTTNPGWSDFSGPSSARWISVSDNGDYLSYDDDDDLLPTSFVYRTTFDLTGYNASTATLTFSCGSDNYYDGVSLNGTTMAATCAQYALGSEQTFSSGFATGVNTLDFQTRGDGRSDGFIFQQTSFEADVTAPEPASFVLFGTGLAGIALIRRRKVQR